MRRVSRVRAVLALPFRALVAAYDERNVRRLAQRLGCSMDEARRVYQLARRDGFGAAHDAVFGTGPTVTAEMRREEPNVRDSHRA